MPLIDGLSRKEVELLTIRTLLAANTMAADRVYEPRPWPATTALFPMIIASAPRDRKISLTRGQLQFLTTISLVVVGRVTASSAEDAQLALDTLAGEIEEALFTAPGFAGQFQQFATVETASSVNAEGRSWIGECAITLDCELVQTWEPTGVPLLGVGITITKGPGGSTMAAGTVDIPPAP